MNDIEKILKHNRIKFITVGIILLVCLMVAGCVSLCMGTMKISLVDIIGAFTGKNVAENIMAVIWNIRLPRIICAVVVGAGLGVSGVIFQGILQNPLADPYTIGISTGASFGASIALVLSINLGIYFPVTLCALTGALLTLMGVIFIARKGKSLESSSLIIAGIIISSILSSGVSFLKMLAGESVSAIVFWIMGSMSAVGWNDVALVLPVVTICSVIAAVMADKLDIMSLGDSNAQALGVNTNRLRLVYLIIGSVITAVCVSVCGVIGFVGLIVPHLLRFWLTAKNSVLIPMSAVLGGVLLLIADSITRVFSAGEIPVGVLTTLIGGPFFIFVFTYQGGKNRV